MNFFKDKSGKIVIAQRPNAPLWLALAFFIIEFYFEGTVASIGKIGSLTSLIFWSYLEIVHGVNGFRKVLGAVVLVFQIYRIVKLLFV